MTLCYPIPYAPATDDAVAIVLLSCFLLSAYALARGRRFLLQLAKDFLSDRQRTSLFAYSTTDDMRYLLLLILQTCVLGGVYVFACFADARPELTAGRSSLLCMAVYTGFWLAVTLLRWLLYSAVGATFFQSAQTGSWLESYLTLLYYLGFVLYPLLLLSVYLDWPVELLLAWGILVALCFKIMVFYKWKQLFCDNLHGILLLFLYFCALEIVPCFVLYRALIQITDNFLINF